MPSNVSISVNPFHPMPGSNIEIRRKAENMPDTLSLKLYFKSRMEFFACNLAIASTRTIIISYIYKSIYKSRF